MNTSQIALEISKKSSAWRSRGMNYDGILERTNAKSKKAA